MQLVLAPSQQVFIDFPEAKIDSPTTCLAIEISKEKISQVADHMNVTRTKTLPSFAYQTDLLHTKHNQQTQHLLARMLHLFSENEQDRRFFIDLALDELIARLLQQQSRDWLLHCVAENPHKCGLSAAIHYLEENLSDPIDIDKLCKIACMSRSKFFALFKQAMHTTPEQWRLHKRLNHAKRLLERGLSVTEVALSLGFSHPSQFSRTFKNVHTLSPKAYQAKFTQ
jgi:transcriptional regulator GlxA family with amidase domain